MSGKGNYYDNAATESFLGSLKDECVHRTFYQAHEEARQSLFEYLEIFYIRQRRHSSLGYLSRWPLSSGGKSQQKTLLC